jgi:hypothetical protein
MGLEDGRCDSCEKEVSFLFPIAITIELPTGGFAMRVRYYCIDCYETLTDTAHDDLEEEEEQEEEENNQNEDEIKNCACCGKKLIGRHEELEEFYCYGCGNYICTSCSLAYEGIGKHVLLDHREACKKKGLHE